MGPARLGEEREITKVRSELSMEGHFGQRQCSNTLAVAAAGDADPAKEGHVGCPATCKDAERIRELCFESQQGSQLVAYGPGDKEKLPGNSAGSKMAKNNGVAAKILESEGGGGGRWPWLRHRGCGAGRKGEGAEASEPPLGF
ncbi:hypothetical protein HU200_003351 [Digitaria exilis]|uniref:Uncharacterized protein n=1 Tax=Digitaria exilis TaxID=1010633 RepID=A0A835FVM3_9POAL|nr:hypothetical protein HU200_003351 [Digitaria exilis]